VFNWRLVLALIVGVFGSTQPLSAATQTVSANIAFANPLQVSSSKEINLPVLITINTFGSLWIDRQQVAENASDQHHDSINFTGPNDQLMNFLTLAYSEDASIGGMVPIKSICSLNGKDEGGCDKLYGSIQNDEKSLYSGMDTVFLTSLAPSASKNSKLSFFDLCAVYQ
jgi:hypothetical protein